MSQIVLIAASNGRYFRGCSFGQRVECVWSSSARTLHEPGNPRKLENLIERAMEKSPGTIVVYADVLLNSLPTPDPRCTIFRNDSSNFYMLSTWVPVLLMRSMPYFHIEFPRRRRRLVPLLIAGRVGASQSASIKVRSGCCLLALTVLCLETIQHSE